MTKAVQQKKISIPVGSLSQCKENLCHCSHMKGVIHLDQGRIQDFLKGGSKSGVDIEGGANCSIVSLKQGVWGAQPPRSYGVFNFG